MTSTVPPNVPLADAAPDVLTLLAPLSGILVPLADVPDPAFAQRLAGDGISIDPLSAQLLAPCAGRVLQVHRAGHALTIDADGLEILIHIGLDTVMLKGEGFTPRVRAGDAVRAGDVLIDFDADLVARRARSLLTQILVTNGERVAQLRPQTGRVVAGRDAVLQIVRMAAAVEGAPVDGRAPGEPVESAPIVVAVESGLHARPSAALSAAARRFTADVRLVKDGREANLRSVVSIMALEVLEGDTVRIVGRGADAAAAVAALTQTLTDELAVPAPASAPSAPALRGAAPSPAAPRADGVLRGVPASPGVAVGQVYQLRHDDAVLDERAADPNLERRTLDAAIASAHLQLAALQTRLAAEADAEKAAIFAAHQELLEDPEVIDRAAADIREGASAAFAWRQAYSGQAARLLTLKSPLLAARATDLRDVGRRVLHLLVGGEDATREVPPDSIVVAEDLAPSDAATLDRTRVRAFCTTMGSASSHVAILARGLGIPAVAGIDPRVLDLAPGMRVVLDGDAGTLKAAPSAEEEAAIVARRARADERRAVELAAAGEPATTRDGHRMEVVANIGDVHEAERVPGVGGEGVGLLRTEFVFMDRRTAPNEDEQTAIYEAIARALGPERLLVIRTLDVGGDKPLPYLPVAAEANPFLGERGIRLTLARPELFRDADPRDPARVAERPRGDDVPDDRDAGRVAGGPSALVEEERAALGAAGDPGRHHGRDRVRRAPGRALRARGRLLLDRHERPDAVHARHGPRPTPASRRRSTPAPVGPAAHRADGRRRARARAMGRRLRRDRERSGRGAGARRARGRRAERRRADRARRQGARARAVAGGMPGDRAARRWPPPMEPKCGRSSRAVTEETSR